MRGGLREIEWETYDANGHNEEKEFENDLPLTLKMTAMTKPGSIIHDASIVTVST